jgi:tetratricopeptide (TPR) repeat protein
MKLNLLIVILLYSQLSFSQKKPNCNKIFQEAENYFVFEDFKEALPLYLRLDSIQNKALIKYRIGLCYLFSDFEKEKAIEYLLKSSEYANIKSKSQSYKSNVAPIEVYFFLGIAYRVNNKLDKAIEQLNKYKSYLNEKNVNSISLVNQELNACYNAKKSISNSIELKIENIDAPVNGKFSNLHPVVTCDENLIIFQSKRKFYDAICISYKKDNKWTEPINITTQIGSDGNYYPVSISSDKKTLFLIKKDIFGDDIAVSYFDEMTNTWSKAHLLGRNINSNQWENFCSVSPDGNTLYFSSNRDGGFGGFDIYKSEKGINGEWQNPINLGPNINTPFDEICPVISCDGNILYFSSKGYNTIGGFDIFYSVINNKIFSYPLNMGYPINTTDDDIQYYPVAEENTGYISKPSDKSAKVFDIYRYKFASANKNK